MSIANYFTLIRIFISPVFLLVFIEHESLGISSLSLPFVLIVLLAIAELSDVMDGYLARKYNQVSDLGKILDPMADSIARLSVFLTFTLDPIQVPMIFIFMFLYRDSVVSTLRTICALRGYALAARISGKIKAVIQATAAFIILMLLIPHALGYLSTAKLQWFSSWIVGIAATYAMLTGIEYVWTNRSYVAKLLNIPSPAK